MRTGLIAWHVFKDGVRDRMLFSVLGFAVFLFAASMMLGQLTAGQDLKIIKDLGLSVIELAGVLMAVLIGVGLVAREIDKRSIYGLLARPVHRREFVIGKYLGLLLTLAVNVAVMTIALFLVLAYIRATSSPAVQMSWEAPALDPALMTSAILIMGELTIVTAISLFFSTFSSSALWSTLFSLGVFVAGTMSTDLNGLAASTKSPAITIAGRVVAAVLPDIRAFDVKSQVVHGLAVPPMFVGMTLGYAALYSAAVLVAAVVAFSRRNFE